MKKYLALFVSALLLASLLLGCQGTGSNKGGAAAPSDAGSSAPKAEASAPEAAPEAEKFVPKKPITIVTYVAAGGNMDVSCRKFVQVAAKYTDATFVVENRTGAGGLIAQDYVLSQPADGYTVYGTTSSNISAINSGGHDEDKYVWGFDWIAMIMKDPISIVITNEDKNKGVTFETLMEKAKEQNGEQIWVGPSTGGTKHIASLKIWEAYGVEGNYVPFESGPMAMNALLGGQGAAGCANPSDTEGRELWNAAVASKERLPKYPDTPTFGELGHPELDSLMMWRGFAVKKDTPAEMVEWFQELTQQVTEDPEWIEFFENIGVQVVNYGNEEFEAIIRQDMEDNIHYMTEFGLI